MAGAAPGPISRGLRRSDDPLHRDRHHGQSVASHQRALFQRTFVQAQTSPDFEKPRTEAAARGADHRAGGHQRQHVLQAMKGLVLARAHHAFGRGQVHPFEHTGQQFPRRGIQVQRRGHRQQRDERAQALQAVSAQAEPGQLLDVLRRQRRVLLWRSRAERQVQRGSQRGRGVGRDTDAVADALERVQLEGARFLVNVDQIAQVVARLGVHDRAGQEGFRPFIGVGAVGRKKRGKTRLGQWRGPDLAQMINRIAHIGARVLAQYQACPVERALQYQRRLGARALGRFHLNRTVLLPDHGSGHTIPLQRKQDQSLMELVIQSNLFTPKECTIINYCRQYLQVHTVADIALAGGSHADQALIDMTPSLLSSTSTLIEPIQEKPQTNIAQALWRRATRLWCNTVTGCLHKPLGKWLHPGPKLRRSWPYYYDPVSQNILCRTAPSTFTVHTPVISSTVTQTPRYHLQSTRDTTILPAQSYPVECVETRKIFKIVRHCEVVSPASTSHSPSFLQNLPVWDQQLLGQLDTTYSHRDILTKLEETVSTKPPLVTPDGSVHQHTDRGTFGWVLATHDGSRLLTCKGPAGGIHVDSFRAEAYGLLSALVYLNKLSAHFGVALPPIHIHTDSLSNIKRISSYRHRKRPEFPNETLKASWDIHQAIHRELKQLPQVTIYHVKSHQDNDTPESQLSVESRLNIEADHLASEAYNTSTFEDIVPMAPGVGAQFDLDGKTVTAHYRTIARDARRTQAIKERIQTKFEMSDAAIQQIDWESHNMAVTRSQQSQPFIVKMIHQLLPIGTAIHRYDPVKYLITCPTCQAHDETFDHFFHCSHSSRQSWKSDMRKELLQYTDKTQTCVALQEILLTGIHSWLYQLPFPDNQFSPQWQELITSQSDIGWKQLLMGRFSNKWTELQYKHLKQQRKPITNTNHGTIWLSSIINIIWTHCHLLWEARNKDKHGHDTEAEKQKIQEQVQRRMTVLYELKSRCFPTDQRKWFHPTLATHVTREPKLKQQQQWLTTYEPMIRRTILDRNNITNRHHMHTIDEYFPLLLGGTASE